ncbi:MAG: DUF551 domain-containing protein [Clostridia bacterium]|nr:DUF551 domain-containing protein [Clostridia bacterium]
MALDIEKCKECYYADEDGVCEKCCVDNAAFEPKRPNERITEWISVKDRLPEEGIDVLVYDDDTDMFFIAWYDETLDKWLNADNGRLFGVTHWMPLPNPPKEK